MYNNKVIQGKVIYKTIDDVDLLMHVFEPAIREPKPASAIVFFFGGGWVSGSPAQFFEHCRRLASRGMVAFSAEYRVKSRHDVSPRVCVRDAKSAVRWIRSHAAEYGLNTQRIAAGGGSAGGHVAACTGLLRGNEEPGDNPDVSSRPDALVLFNPVLDTTIGHLAERVEGKKEAISPQHNIRPGLPPTIIFHGMADTTVPFVIAERFTSTMRGAGNRCELLGFEDKTHGFFNYGRDDGIAYLKSVKAMEDFLNSLDFLSCEPPAVLT